MIDTIREDLKYAARSLRRTPGFTVMAIATLALGIGANTAIFTLLDAVMFKPLNVPSPHDLVTLYERPREGDPDSTGGTGRYLRFSYPRFERLRAALGPAGSLAAMTRTSTFVVRFPGQTRAESVRAQLVSAEYFSVLDVPIATGRSIGTDDVRFAGAARSRSSAIACGRSVSAAPTFSVSPSSSVACRRPSSGLRRRDSSAPGATPGRTSGCR
jgi:hypothetical protein